MKRKEFLKGLAGLGVLPMISGPSRAAANWRMPAEWEPHDYCVMAFCAAYDMYDRRDLDQMRREQATVAKAISRFEPVTMLANADDVGLAKKLCGPDVTVARMKLYDVWTRDTLPTILAANDGSRRALGWNFNAWGGKFDGFYEADLDLAERFAKWAGIPFEAAPLVMEGGGIEVDGQGLLITTETAILNDYRNPGLTRREAEAIWKRFLGVEKVVWLYGSDVDAVTDGHVDGVAKFLAPGRLAIEVTDDREDPEYHELEDNRARLKGLTDAGGKAVDIHPVLRPRYDRIGERGEDFAGAYVNAYIANGGLVMPKFGDEKRDEAARQLFEKLSARPAVSVAIDTIVEGGGGIHCNTQQIPKPE